jgi:PKD repeat protein
VDGTCTDQTHVCSPQHPNGTCDSGQTCLDGACVANELLCGPGNPDGLCPSGEVCTDGSCQPVAPVARLACPLTGLVDETLEFDASASTDDVGIVSYHFVFGDGDSLSGADATVNHAYTVENTYTVILTVEDGDGLTDTDSCVLSVQDDTPVNTPPSADFTVVRLGSLDVQVDATASYDAESSELEVRWDFEDDGIWETTWSLNRLAAHTYPADNTYTIRLEVRDPQGEADFATRTVAVSSGDTPIYAPGIIQADTTWSGTVIMANDVTVESEATLTITAGTQVLVAGNYTLESNGPLMITGTAGAPVLFTTYYAADNQPGSWQGILCMEGTTDIDHLIVEYGTTCLTLWSDGIRVDYVEARFCETGIQVWRDTDLTWVTTHDNTVDGLSIGGTSANVRNSQSYRNGSSGIHFNDWSSSAVYNVFQTSCTDNGLHGLFKEGPGTLNMTEVDLLRNGADGARFAENNQGYPEIIVRNSTFSDNAESGIRLDSTYSQYYQLSLDAQNCDIVGNRDGVHAAEAVLALQKNQISGNRRYGLKVDSRVLGSAVHQNNIYGNSTEAGFMVVDPQISLVTDDAFVGTESTTWSTPNGEWIGYLRYHIIGGGDSYYFRIGSSPGGGDVTNGWVSGGDMGRDLFMPPTKLFDTLYVELEDQSDTSGLTLTIEEVGHETASAITELHCVYDGPVDADLDLTDNYWGTADPLTVSFLRGSGATDLSGALASPVPDAGRP